MSRPCCKQKVCQSCMYRHVQSVFSEGFVGDGRTKLLCPLGCGTSMSDSEIRDIFRREHYSIRKHIVGPRLLKLLKATGFFYCFQSLFRRRLEDPYFAYFRSLTLSQKEREDLFIYERWNLAISMAQKKGDNSTEFCMQCPAPDCNYVYLTSTQHRREKIANEPYQRKKSYNEGNTNLVLDSSKNMTKAVTTWLTYRPPKPEKRTSRNNKWFDAEEIYYQDMSNQGRLAQRYPNSRDGRRCVCPKCHALYCGLCSRPWKTIHNSLFGNKRISHDGQTCYSYDKYFSKNEELNASFFAAQSINARMCPGCSTWTERSSGCNHMTCRCGFEWCYVCETGWNNTHYACVMRANGEASSMCIVC